jgi:serine/threonine protein kinase
MQIINLPSLNNRAETLEARTEQMMRLPSLSNLPESRATWIDQKCLAFEQAWREGRRPSIGDHLKEAPDEDRRVLFRFLLELELDLRRSDKEEPALDDYRERFPDYEDIVTAVFYAEPRTEPYAGPPDDEELPSVHGYDIVRKVGRGGMGTVYLAWKTCTDTRERIKLVALKMITKGQLASRNEVSLFLEERKAHARLDDDRIVRVYEVGEHEGQPYYTMQFMEGGSLAKLIGGAPLPSERAAEILLPVAQAVQYFHDHKGEDGRPKPIIHRDLTPANILFDRDGRPHVTDFGLARILPRDTTQSFEQGIVGTFPYVAPELAKGQFSRRSDIYGLGAILYEMLTGRPPFRGTTPLETLWQVQEMEPVPPRVLNPAVDRRLERICLRCLAKDPAHRYQSAGELIADLERYRNGERVPGEPLWQWLKRQIAFRTHFGQAEAWSRIALVAAGYSLLGHALMYLLLRSGPSTAACWLWYVGFESIGLLIPWLMLWPQRQLHPVSRGVLLNWVGAVLADTVLFSLFCPPGGTAVPEVVVRVYPVWMTANGLMWFMEARSYWGRFYLVGLGFFVAAALMPLSIDLAPLILGFVNCAALTWLALGLRRIAAEQAKPPTAA